MFRNAEHLFVLTGGPGSGKTSLIEALGQAGYARMTEAGRSIIQDQVLIGGEALPWKNPAAYAELMLSWELRSHHLAQDLTGPVFFDRGVPDIVGYLQTIKFSGARTLGTRGGDLPVQPPRLHRPAMARHLHAG